jgi:4-hydroxybenzoate polyprenyltransferase
MSANETARPADAMPATWVDRFAPAGMRPYLRLMRADRPIGVWLLLWPCWWSILMAAAQDEGGLASGDIEAVAFVLYLMVLFAAGSIVMRGAGCTYNDIVDRDIDAKVARTAGRPLPSGQVSVREAVVFLVVLLLAGLAVLLSLNSFSIWLGAASLVPVAIYPFMKRITDWPQAFLGFTFNWGALLGWSAVTGGLALAPLLLFAGSLFWTLGYDTIYAHQDKDDDAVIGVRSTARLFGAETKRWVGVFYALAFVLLCAAGAVAGLGLLFLLAMLAVGAHLAWQVWRLDIHDADNCLAVFRSNREVGLLVIAATCCGVLSVSVT